MSGFVSNLQVSWSVNDNPLLRKKIQLRKFGLPARSTPMLGKEFGGAFLLAVMECLYIMRISESLLLTYLGGMGPNKPVAAILTVQGLSSQVTKTSAYSTLRQCMFYSEAVWIAIATGISRYLCKIGMNSHIPSKLLRCLSTPNAKY